MGLTCLNGLFRDPCVESLADALLKAQDGGAVAVWASSGFTAPQGQATMGRELVRVLFDEEVHPTLGEATVWAMEGIRDQDIGRTWILFGDPCTRLCRGGELSLGQEKVCLPSPLYPCFVTGLAITPKRGHLRLGRQISDIASEARQSSGVVAQRKGPNARANQLGDCRVARAPRNVRNWVHFVARDSSQCPYNVKGIAALLPAIEDRQRHTKEGFPSRETMRASSRSTHVSRRGDGGFRFFVLKDEQEMRYKERKSLYGRLAQAYLYQDRNSLCPNEPVRWGVRTGLFLGASTPGDAL